MVFIPIISLVGCSKSGNDTSINYPGSYKGDIEIYYQGYLIHKLSNHTIVLAPTTTPGKVTLTNNVLVTTSANLSGNSLTIPDYFAETNPHSDIVESGTGTFSGNTLTIVFYRQEVAKIGNGREIIKWTGVLTKQ